MHGHHYYNRIVPQSYCRRISTNNIFAVLFFSTPFPHHVNPLVFSLSWNATTLTLLFPCVCHSTVSVNFKSALESVLRCNNYATELRHSFEFLNLMLVIRHQPTASIFIECGTTINVSNFPWHHKLQTNYDKVMYKI